ncbi:hypothetical protein CAPTEDRAFT_218828 [Capitella teleta]|uniref:EamA domain-containing protein n=1 Tax=Capitella teleta TaxID=283909 RepID=R7TUW9_CAPTE|nr:hypothetical protein CAPTEDRAFT_218828 [Capitella teleta]|eukprot:ELT97357.1 hypothetical protein CAPTEDRAFT_218828 [Capitella teleta]
MAFRCISLLLSVLVLTCRIVTFIASPLWLDALEVTWNSTTNSSNSSSERATNVIDPYFAVLSQTILPTTLFGILFGALCLFRPIDKTYSDVEREHPKLNFLFVGMSMAVSSCIINFSLSGTRSAPYLIALFGNFIVPIQFITRFLIIGRKPTRRKLVCATVIVGAEFLCLLPTIFPSLESTSSHSEDRGARGIAGILWPMTYVLGLIPGTMTNAYMERSVKNVQAKAGSRGSAFDLTQINMAYYLFGFSLSFCVFTLGLFWLDLLPVYGTCDSSAIIFIERMRFNFACLFGQECSAWVVSLGWATLSANTAYLMVNAYLLRYSEGSNYMVLIMTLRSPILFIFWTMFDEYPFVWHPHTSLSTWLSIAALLIMVPMVYLYNTGQPEVSNERIYSRHVSLPDETDDQGPLLGSASIYPETVHVPRTPVSLNDNDWAFESRGSLS